MVPVVTSKLVVTTHFMTSRYVMTSKEHLTNSQILFKYFQLVFFQLQLLKIRTNLLSFDSVVKERKGMPFYLNAVTPNSKIVSSSNSSGVGGGGSSSSSSCCCCCCFFVVVIVVYGLVA